MDFDEKLDLDELRNLEMNLWSHEDRYDNDEEFQPLFDEENVLEHEWPSIDGFSINELIFNAEGCGDRVLVIRNKESGEIILDRKEAILAEEQAWEEAMENEASKVDDEPDAELDAPIAIETLKQLEVWMFNHEAGGPDGGFKKACDELDIEHFEKFDVVTVRDVLDDIELGGDLVISLRTTDGTILLDRQQDFADEGHKWAMTHEL
ncbi:hypothetical protein [Mesorhizobium sp. SP-1A]|uniref:hypothetical protein n=1 Tax=Mesorhizobium sp. SP-1A TaxID=3077840 RepID=UPI0028F7125D|nr:hypothetical protein [Mesorhizobium sp. SP-1A]